MLAKLKNWFSETFDFNRQQLRGFLVLIFLILLLILARIIFNIIPVQSNHDFETYGAKIKDFENNLKSVNEKKTESNRSGLFPFDPNNLPDDEWKKLGLSDRQVAVIKRYEAKGGKFHSKDDLKKMYCISPDEYARLEPYIEIDKTMNSSPASAISETPKSRINPFPFNPNGLPEEKWKMLGLTEKQIKAIKNYESKGGKFYRKEDVKKMYVISPEEYAILESFIEIPLDSANNRYKAIKSNNSDISKQIQIVELNSADSVTLTQIPGIGPVYASRIIKYREKLGGYYNIIQLLEVYGIDTVKFSKFRNYISVNEASVKKIKINTVDFKDLMKHPYFPYPITKAIFELKNKKGYIADVNEIKSIPIIYNDLFSKIKPYISTQN